MSYYKYKYLCHTFATPVNMCSQQVWMGEFWLLLKKKLPPFKPHILKNIDKDVHDASAAALHYEAIPL